MTRHKLFLNTGFISLSLLVSSMSFAGTVFLPEQPRAVDQSGGEEFPESRFGSGPMRKISEGYAAREVNEMETPDEESGKAPGATRGIASVQSSSGGETVDLGGESPIITSQAATHSAGTQDVPASVVSRKGIQEVSIIASDLGYFPKTIFVSRDVPVRLFVTSSSKNTLCIMMDSFQVRRQVKIQKIEEITFVPNVPGKYRFYCPVNGMEGSLVVKELSSSFAQDDSPTGPMDQGGTLHGTSHRSSNEPSNAASNVLGRVPAGDRQVPAVASAWESAVEQGNPTAAGR